MTTGYVVGPALIGVGILVLYGGVSGRLPAMIAALFDPSLLVPKTTTQRTATATQTTPGKTVKTPTTGKTVAVFTLTHMRKELHLKS
jgi:hypothetical protein